MGKLELPSGHQILDIDLLATMVSEINNLQDILSKKGSKIYTTSGVSPSDTSTSQLSIATAYTEITTDKFKVNEVKSATIAFGKNFSEIPIVTATPVVKGTTITAANTTAVSLIITNITKAGVTVSVSFNSKIASASIGINVIAIGLS